MATKLGLFKNVAIANENSLTADEVARLVANAMDIPFVTYEGVSGGPTCLWEIWEISEGTGRVIANSNMGIAVSKTAPKRVNISGKIYYTRVDIPNELVGAQVTFYTIPGERGNEVVSIFEERQSENITLDADEIDTVSDKGGYLEITDVKDNSIRVDKQGYLMINGKVRVPSKALFNLLESGSATFLDTDADGYYDVIHMTLLYQMVIEGVNAETMTLRTRFDKVTLDLSKVDVLDIYVGKKSAEFSDLKDGMVVGIACDKFTITGSTITYDFSNAEYLRFYASNRNATGMIDGLGSSDTFSINNTERTLGSGYNRLVAEGKLPALKLGLYVKAYYDNYGELTYYEVVPGTEAMNYGYLVAGGVEGGSLERITKLKILDVNGNIQEFSTSKKFILDGATVDSGSTAYSVNAPNDVNLTTRQVIRYRAIEGVVREVDTTVIRGTAENALTSLDTVLAFEGDSRYIRSGSVAREYAFAQDAIMFIDEADPAIVNPPDYYFSVRNASSISNGSYKISGYDINDDLELACAVRHDGHGATGELTKDSLPVASNCYVVGEIWRTVDSEGELCWKISAAGNNEVGEFMVPLRTLQLYCIDIDNPLNSMIGRDPYKVWRHEPSTFESVIKTGDIIRFTTNTAGEITYIEKLFDFASNKENLVLTEYPYDVNGSGEKQDKGASVAVFVELDKISGNNFIYRYNTDKRYVSQKAIWFSSVPLYHVSTGKVELVPFEELPSAATGNKVRAFIRYYNYGETRDNLFYIYD